MPTGRQARALRRRLAQTGISLGGGRHSRASDLERHTPGAPAGGAPAAAPFRNANAAKSEDAWASDGSHAGGKRGRKCFSSFARSAYGAAAEPGLPSPEP